MIYFKKWLIFLAACQVNVLISGDFQKKVTFNLALKKEPVASFSIKRFLNLCVTNEFKKQRRMSDCWVGDFLKPVYREVPVIDRPLCMLINQANKKHHSKYSKLFLRDLPIIQYSSNRFNPNKSNSLSFIYASIRNEIEIWMQDIEVIKSKHKLFSERVEK